MATYKLNRVIHQEERGEQNCFHCGYKGLKNLYYLMGDNGVEVVVGSECAPQLLFEMHLKEFEDTVKHVSQARKEWAAKLPKPRPSDTQESYINRRLPEIQNGILAKQEWVGVKSVWAEAKKRLQDRGIEHPHDMDKGNFSENHNILKMLREYDRLNYLEQVKIIQDIADRYGTMPSDIADVSDILATIKVLELYIEST